MDPSFAGLLILPPPSPQSGSPPSDLPNGQYLLFQARCLSVYPDAGGDEYNSSGSLKLLFEYELGLSRVPSLFVSNVLNPALP